MFPALVLLFAADLPPAPPSIAPLAGERVRLVSRLAGHPEDTFESLSEEFDAAYAVWRRKPRAERGDAPFAEFFPRFLVVGEGGDGRAMLWVLRKMRFVEIEGVDEPSVADAFATRLIDEHAGEEWLRPLAITFELDATLPREKREAHLRRWLERGVHESITREVRYWFGSILFEAGTEAKRAEAVRLYEALVEEDPSDMWARRAEGDAFRETRLRVGMVVPDFETKDVDGLSFKLSDYRGKVVLLDFWGFW